MKRIILFMVFFCFLTGCVSQDIVTNSNEREIRILIKQLKETDLLKFPSGMGVPEILHTDITRKILKYGKEAVPFLLEAIRSENQSIRVLSIFCLGEMNEGKKELESMERIYEDKRNRNDESFDIITLSALYSALGKIYEIEMDMLIEQLKAIDIKRELPLNNGVYVVVGNEITREIVKHKTLAVSYLLKLIHSENISVKLFSIYCLGELTDGWDELENMLEFYGKKIMENPEEWDATIISTIKNAIKKLEEN